MVSPFRHGDGWGALLHLRAGVELGALAVAFVLAGCGSSGTGGDGGNGSGGSGGGGPASTFEECEAEIDIDLTCADASVAYVAFIPGETCTGSASFSGDERLVFSTVDVMGNEAIDGATLAAVPAGPTGSTISWSAPEPVPVVDAMPPFSWPGRVQSSPGTAAVTFAELRGESGTLDLDALTSGEVRAGTFTIEGGEADVPDDDGGTITVATPEAEVRGCFEVLVEL